MAISIKIPVLLIFALSFIFFGSSSFSLHYPAQIVVENNSVEEPPPVHKKKKGAKKHNKKKPKELIPGVAIFLGGLGILVFLIMTVIAFSFFFNLMRRFFLMTMLGMIALGVIAILALVGAIFSFLHAHRMQHNNGPLNRLSVKTNVLIGIICLILSLIGLFFGISFLATGLSWSLGFVVLGVLLLALTIVAMIFSILAFVRVGNATRD